MTRLQSIAFATLLSLAAAGTVWVASFSWQAFTSESHFYLVPLLVIALVVATVGAVVRALRGGPWLTFLAQLVLGGAVTSRVIGGSFLPVGEGWHDLSAAVGRASETAMGQVPPVPSGGTDGLAPILLLCGFGCLLMVDLVAVGLRYPSVAGLPLLAVVSVPFGVSGVGVSWWAFAVTVFGYLTLIGLHENERVARWGRPLDDAEQLPRPPRGAALVASSATALAVLVPVATPGLDLNLLGSGFGSGKGEDITVSNPLVSMRKDLVQGPDLPAVTLSTDDPDPSYLRLAVLTRFSNEEWSAGTRDVPRSQTARGPMPPLQGVGEQIPLRQSRYQVSVAPGFDSTWLPTQSQLQRIDANGDWRYDVSTMDFIAADDDLSAADLDYTFTAVEPQLTSTELADADAGTTSVDASYTELPSDVPPSVERQALQVTDQATSSFERAVELQQWFRQDGGFTYSTEVDLGSGPSDLVSFLEEDNRTGFCQQFATAMAVMARELGIPARVAIGFLSPEHQRDDVYVYSTHDMHAWPELYFAGYGWVAFEPTPSARVAQVPSYTRGVNSAPEPQAPGGASAVPEPQNGQDRTQQRAPRPEDTPTQDGRSADPGFPWGPVLGVSALVIALGGLVLLPSVLRRRRRTRRRADGGPEELWAELRDTVLDLGLTWPGGLSPRATGHYVLRYLSTPEGRTALDALVAALETSRYSPRGSDTGSDLLTELDRVIADLRAGASSGVRRRAGWWPRSALGAAPATRTVTPVSHQRLGSEDEEEDVVEHVR